MGSQIRATDDEALASQLWGEAKRWDEGRQQFVPTGGSERPSPGDSSPPSTGATGKTPSASDASPPPSARTTGRRSKKDRADSDIARSTGGSGPKDE